MSFFAQARRRIRRSILLAQAGLCYIYMSGSNDIQVAFSSKSLKVHGKLTQQDSVRADT